MSLTNYNASPVYLFDHYVGLYSFYSVWFDDVRWINCIGDIIDVMVYISALYFKSYVQPHLTSESHNLSTIYFHQFKIVINCLV